jgi:hypothetical protein
MYAALFGTPGGWARTRASTTEIGGAAGAGTSGDPPPEHAANPRVNHAQRLMLAPERRP